MSHSIPYTVIGGFLGAGKTTLLNNLLRNNPGLRLAILVNDFGDINIDADLIAAHDGETLNLANGCICCSLVNGFMSALAKLQDHAAEIDHIIIEASGISDPERVGQVGAMLALSLHGVIVLADGEQLRTLATNVYLGDLIMRQLRAADLLVLNKIDLLTSTELAEVKTWLQDVVPDVPVIEATYGQVPIDLLLGIHEDGLHDEAHETRGDAGVAVGNSHAHHHDDSTAEDHASIYASWSFTASEAITTAALEAFVDDLPAGILRAKGILYLADEPSRRHLFQLVGARWSVTPGEPWRDEPPESRLVLIGLPGTIDGQAFGEPFSPFGQSAHPPQFNPEEVE